jgi:hypothetical protein
MARQAVVRLVALYLIAGKFGDFSRSIAPLTENSENVPSAKGGVFDVLVDIFRVFTDRGSFPLPEFARGLFGFVNLIADERRTLWQQKYAVKVIESVFRMIRVVDPDALSVCVTCARHLNDEFTVGIALLVVPKLLAKVVAAGPIISIEHEQVAETALEQS